jgi:hypothetical protein
MADKLTWRERRAERRKKNEELARRMKAAMYEAEISGSGRLGAVRAAINVMGDAFFKEIEQQDASAALATEADTRALTPPPFRRGSERSIPQNHWLPGFNFNVEEWDASAQTYETLAICRTLALARAAFAAALAEKPAGRFMIRSRTRVMERHPDGDW